MTMKTSNVDGIPANLPLTIAISSNSDNAKEVVRKINRLILPQDTDLQTDKKKLNRKVFLFSFQNKEEKVPIACIYIKGTNKVVNYLLYNNCLVENQNNKLVLDTMRTYIDQFNYYFIRRRGRDDNWYTMLYVNSKP